MRPPAPALQRFISHYAGFCADGMTPGTHAGLPSRHAHLIISLDAPIEVIEMPNSTQAANHFSAMTCGLHDAPATVRRGSRVEGVHVFLRPFGLRAVLGVSARECASRVYDLSELWGRPAAELVERLGNAATWDARFAVLDEIFGRALSPVEPSTAVVWAWRQLAVSHGRTSIEELARAIGWSRQHFTERFRTELGLAPKTAARIFRFEHACQSIKNARLPLAEIAAVCGYHDQAHMTREWNALAGCSPRVWISRELPFLQDYELAVSDNSG